MSTAAIAPLTDTAAIALATGTDDAPKPVITVGDRSTKNKNGSVTTPLLYPVQSEGSTLSAITMRRATVKELKEVDNMSGLTSICAMVAKLGSLPPSTIDQIDAEYFGELGLVITSFLPKGRLAGIASA